MNWNRSLRTVLWALGAGAFAIVPFTATTGIEACGESGQCTQLRQTEYAALQAWEACDPENPTSCLIFPGNPKDCTGVLTCDLAVNPAFRTQVEQAVLVAGQQSQGCYLCAVPDCPAGSVPYCDPISRRCYASAGVVDGGEVSFAPSPPSGDAGQITVTPPTPTRDAGEGGT